MDSKKENILAFIIFMGLAMHFGVGYFFWDEIKFVNLYYVSVYFLADACGLVIYIIAHSSWLKGAGAVAMGLGTFYLYKEFNDPTYWVERDYITLGLVLVNMLFIWLFADKIKNKSI